MIAFIIFPILTYLFYSWVGPDPTSYRVVLKICFLRVANSEYAFSELLPFLVKLQINYINSPPKWYAVSVPLNSEVLIYSHDDFFIAMSVYRELRCGEHGSIGNSLFSSLLSVSGLISVDSKSGLQPPLKWICCRKLLWSGEGAFERLGRLLWGDFLVKRD